MTIDISRHSSSVESENPEGHVDACLRSGDQLPPSVSNVKGGQAAGAVWNFLSALGTPQQWRPTFVRLLGGLAWIARGNANEASPRQLTDASATAAEDVDELKQDCGSREPSFEGQGALLLLPGPDPNPHHDLQPAPYPTFPGSRHFHRASAPTLSLRGVPTVHAHPACGLRAFSSCSPLSVEGCLSYGSLSETLDVAHADGEDTDSAMAAHGAYPPGWRTKPLLALCWYEHKEHAANGNSNGSDAAHAAAKDAEERHAAVSAAPANGHAAVPAAPITVPTLAHKPHHGGVPHAHNRLHGHAHAHAVHPPAPPASCHFVPHRVEMGLATDMGARNAMEDFAFAVPLKAHGAHMEHLQRGSSSDSSTQARAAHVPFTHAVCFGVFDGHGGAEVAESLAAHVPSGIQGRAEHIAVHGPQHVGAILADQERRLRARRHTHHHHHHGHSHQSRSHHVTHAALHAQRHHHGGEPGEHHRRVDASHSTHRRTHSPASSRSPDRRAKPKGPTSAVQAVAMATAAAAQLQAVHIGSAGGARSSHGGNGLATSPERRSHLAPPSHIAPPPTLGELGPADGAAAANGGAAPAAGTLEPAGSTASAISLGSECSSSAFDRSSTGGEPQSQVSSSTAAAASGVPSVHRPVPSALDVSPHMLAAYDLAASPRSECGELGSSCLSDMAGSLSDGPTSSLLGGEGGAGTPHLDGRDPGSTALVAVVIDGAMHVANVGDCRLVLGELVEGGRVIARRVTCDHAPAHHPGEAERLARLQVPVSKDGYVGDYMDLGGGLLQISRSIGDFSTKQQLQERAGAAVVLSDPELHTVTLGPNTLFAVAVSDGVTCRLTDDTIISQVCKFLNESVVTGKPGGSGTAAAPGAGGVPMPGVKRTNNPQYAAQELVKYAVEVMASPDNAAAVVVSFTTEPPPVPQRPRLFTPRSRSCAAVATPSASAADVAVAVAAGVAPTCAP